MPLQSLTLLDALESKIPSELWQHMQSLGYSEEKLADLKLKAYRIRGKAEVKRGNFDDAKQNFEAALKLSRVEKITKELDDLLMEVVKKRASEKKKEKALWQKAFNKRDAGVDDDEPEAASPAKPVRQDKPKPSTAAKEGTVTAQSGFSLTSFLGISVLGVGVGLAIWWLRKRSFK